MLLGLDTSTEYMMIASSERGRCQLHLYQSNDLLNWKQISAILDVKAGSKISPTAYLRFGMNFECACFFSIAERDYIVVAVEEDIQSKRHSQRYTLWLCGTLTLEGQCPKFKISSHGLLDHGVLYAPHVFRDSEDRLLQLGWADETALPHMVQEQGWAGCLTQPRELFEISRPVTDVVEADDIWNTEAHDGKATTLGIRPASQLQVLRQGPHSTSLSSFSEFLGKNCEVEATFSQLQGNEKFIFNLRESPGSVEVTRINFDLQDGHITVDRTKSSIQTLGRTFPDSGHFRLIPGEDLRIQISMDNSILEIYANNRFAITSRVYPSLESSVGASYDFGTFDETNLEFKFWKGLRNAWPGRNPK